MRRRLAMLSTLILLVATMLASASPSGAHIDCAIWVAPNYVAADTVGQQFFVWVQNGAGPAYVNDPEDGRLPRVNPFVEVDLTETTTAFDLVEGGGFHWSSEATVHGVHMEVDDWLFYGVRTGEAQRFNITADIDDPGFDRLIEINGAAVRGPHLRTTSTCSHLGVTDPERVNTIWICTDGVVEDSDGVPTGCQ